MSWDAPVLHGLENGVRRITTGRNAQGRSAVVADETIEGDPRGILIWGADAPPQTGHAGALPTRGWWPPPGGIRVTLGTRAPDSGDASPGRDAKYPFPDIHDAAGFHASDSVDVIIVISGRIWLELDDSELELKGGDVLVQNGVRHRWRNRTQEWPLMACVIFGTADAAPV